MLREIADGSLEMWWELMHSLRQVTLDRPRCRISFILHWVSDISAKTSPPYMGSYLVIRDSEFGKTR